MIGFFTRLWIVMRWLRQLAKRGELKPVLKRACVLTVKDLRFFLQLSMALAFVWLSIHRRRVREESLKHEADRRKQLIALRRMAKRPSIE
jgi:hypothetical protein